jgi:putative ubiquitin-RnfH superfamily antitoxin RatB of RatAB toxin-antitoxin module
MAEGIAVRVVYAHPSGTREIAAQAAAGATLADIIRASGILERCPEIDLATVKIGVWGKVRDAASAAQPNDRIEIYRPLTADPKASRTLRADKKKRAGAKAGR